MQKLLTPTGTTPPELLAPAGSFAAAAAAFEHGADAVYAGIENFNLRAHSPNFSVDEFCELIDFANDNGKKVYGVLNIMPNDDMQDDIEDTLKRLAANLPHNKRGHDLPPPTQQVQGHALLGGFIISDPGVLLIVKEIFGGNIPIHLSTQSGVFNSRAMRFWKEQGVSRVILPRELNLPQIKTLTDSGIMETEVFVHGAMCVSVSGRCLMGTYYNKRHPNLGDCPQPCRFRYKIVPSYEDGVKPPDSPAQTAATGSSDDTGFYAEEDKNGTYLLNSKDLCTVSILPDIIKTGVRSLKIEGRNKSAHYVASVVKVYRDAIDTYFADPQNYRVKDWWHDELEAIEHRPYTTGFYDDAPVKQELFSSKAQAGYRLVGIVKAVINGDPVIDVKNGFSWELFNVLPVKKGQSPFDFKFETILELDGGKSGDGVGEGFAVAGTPTDRARPNRLVILGGASERLRVGDMLRIRN